MRKRNIIPILFLLVILYSCHLKNKPVAANNTLPANAADSIAPQSLFERFQKYLSAPSQTFSISSKASVKITGKKGFIILVEPANLETFDGSALSDSISVQIKEAVDKNDFIANDCPTISDGNILVSGGAYYIQMQSGGKKLKIKEGKSLKVFIPKISDREMKLFYAESDSAGNFNWKETGKDFINKKQDYYDTGKMVIVNRVLENSIIKKTDTGKLLKFDNSQKAFTKEELQSYSGIDFSEINNTKKQGEKTIVIIKDSITGSLGSKTKTGEQKISEIKYYSPIEITNLGWINCDRFYNAPQYTNTYSLNFTDTLRKTLGVIIIFKNLNSVLSNRYLLSGGTNSIYINQKLPLNEDVEFIVYSIKNNQFVHSKTEMRISNNMMIPVKFSIADTNDIKKVFVAK